MFWNITDNVKWILEYLKRVASYENWRPSVLIDKALDIAKRKVN